MNTVITWRRLEPDTIDGEKIIVETVFSSFDKKEIDAIQREFENVYGGGVAICKGDDKQK